MSARFLVTWPCQDACGTQKTDDVVEGAPVYRCPGCDTTWIELNERIQIPDPQHPEVPQPEAPHPEPTQAETPRH